MIYKMYNHVGIQGVFLLTIILMNDFLELGLINHTNFTLLKTLRTTRFSFMLPYMYKRLIGKY